MKRLRSRQGCPALNSRAGQRRELQRLFSHCGFSVNRNGFGISVNTGWSKPSLGVAGSARNDKKKAKARNLKYSGENSGFAPHYREAGSPSDCRTNLTKKTAPARYKPRDCARGPGVRRAFYHHRPSSVFREALRRLCNSRRLRHGYLIQGCCIPIAFHLRITGDPCGFISIDVLFHPVSRPAFVRRYPRIQIPERVSRVLRSSSAAGLR